VRVPLNCPRLLHRCPCIDVSPVLYPSIKHMKKNYNKNCNKCPQWLLDFRFSQRYSWGLRDVTLGARGSVLVKALYYNPEVRGFEIRCCEIFSVYLILPAALGPGIYSASNRNEYQKHKIRFLGSKVRPVRKADNLIAICEPIVYTMLDP
jgi:hypothetical protein